MRWIPALLLLTALGGCGTSHMPNNPFMEKPWMELEWVDTFEHSVEQGLEEDKPVLLILAAGPRTGFT